MTSGNVTNNNDNDNNKTGPAGPRETQTGVDVTTFELAPHTETAPAAPAPQTTTNDTKPATSSTPAVQHTPGGIPAIPAAIVAGNATVGLLSAAAIVAGPVGLVAAAGTVAVAGAVAASRGRKPARRASARTVRAGSAARTGGRTGSRSGGASASGASAGRKPGGLLGGKSAGKPSAGTRKTTGSASTGTAPKKTTGKVPAQSTGRPSAGKASTSSAGKPVSKGLKVGTRGAAKPSAGSASSGSASSPKTGTAPKTGKPTGRVGAIKALRKQAKEKAGSKKGLRKQTSAARQALADQKHSAKANKAANKAALKSARKAEKNAGSTTNPKKGLATGKATEAKKTTAAAGKPSTANGPAKKTTAVTGKGAAPAKTAATKTAPTKGGTAATGSTAKKTTTPAGKGGPTTLHGVTKTTTGPKPGRVARGVAKARNAKHTARAALRKHRDQKADERTERAGGNRRKAPVRRKMHRALVKSAGRHLGRRIAAAAAAAPVGVAGALTTAIGRKTGWGWLMHPGRRLYARLMAKATAQRLERDKAIRDTADTELEQLNNPDAESDRIAPEVPRAPRNSLAPHPATTGETNVTDGMGGVFADSASDVESAAQSYDPEGAMQVLATIESLPAGLQSIANAFKILAEKADSELPLDPAVGEGLADVFEKLQQAIDAAESIPEIFRNKHEADIERIENPRNGAAAESMWDIGNNDI